jgi:DNA-binding ferritin-like protein
MEQPRFLKRDNAAPKAEYKAAPAGGGIESMVSACVSELMNAGTSLHKLHLKITSTGSYAAHKALNELYDAMPDHADDLAESFQGASEKLLVYKEVPARELNTVEEAIAYLRDMTKMVNALQAKMPYSEITNELDNVKSTIDSGKYKLLFLK